MCVLNELKSFIRSKFICLIISNVLSLSFLTPPSQVYVSIMCCIISLLCNLKVKNNIALTGEIDVKGCITKIGGLELKFSGAKKANIETVLIPEDNKNDYEYIKKHKPYILENLNVIIVNNILEVLSLCLINPNKLEFKLE